MNDDDTYEWWLDDPILDDLDPSQAQLAAEIQAETHAATGILSDAALLAALALAVVGIVLADLTLIWLALGACGFAAVTSA